MGEHTEFSPTPEPLPRSKDSSFLEEVGSGDKDFKKLPF